MSQRGYSAITGRTYSGHFDILLLNLVDSLRHALWPTPRRTLGFLNGTAFAQTDERHGITPISPKLQTLWLMDSGSVRERLVVTR